MEILSRLNKDILSGLIQKAAIMYRVNCDSINLQIIEQTVVSEFGNMSVVDFSNAFIKHSAGQFKIAEKEDNNKPYGDLSAYFVCCVLKHYKEFKAKEYLKQKMIAGTDVNLIEYTEDEGRETYELIKKFAAEGKEIRFANWNAAFTYMLDNVFKAFNENEYQSFIYTVINQLNSELKKVKFRSNNEKAIKETLNTKHLLKTEVKKRFILKHFNV